MPQKPEHKPAGPGGGQFIGRARTEAELALPGPGARLTLPEDSFQGRHSGDPDVRPAEWVFGQDGSVDAAVGTVMDGPLSRGVVNARRREAFHAWHDWAQERALETRDPAYDEFAMGLRTGAASLYERRLGAYDPGLGRFKAGGTPTYIAAAAVDIAGTKRTSFEDREHWRELLKRTPSEAWHSGHLAAGLVLSGADGFWGLRDDPDAAVQGPGDDEESDTPSDEVPDNDSNQIFDFEVMGEDGIETYSVDNLGDGNYQMFTEDGTSYDFEHHGDPEDHYSIQDKATAALKAHGIIDDESQVF